MRVYVSTETDFNDTEDIEIEVNKISWYSVKARLSETQEEKDEKRMAMKYQIENGILQRNGLPAGMSPQQYEKYKSETLIKNNGVRQPISENKKPLNKFERKRQRELERQQLKEQKMTQVKLQRKAALEQSKRQEMDIINKIIRERNSNGNNV